MPTGDDFEIKVTYDEYEYYFVFSWLFYVKGKIQSMYIFLRFYLRSKKKYTNKNICK